MKFGLWIEQQESQVTIYLDFDETLAHHTPDGDIVIRPHAHEFIRRMRALAPVYILTHGSTMLQQQSADVCDFNLKVIGREDYHSITPNPNAILVDDRSPDDPRTRSKMEALQIRPDRVVPILPWTGKDQGDRDLLLTIPRIEVLLGQREWVEKTPQCLPKRQPFKTYTKARDMAKELQDKFRKGLREAAQGFKIVSNIKSKTAFHSKTVERGKPKDKVFDVLRGAILVDNKRQIDKVVAALKKTFRVKKVEHKVKPEPPFGYYGATHVDVMVEDMICEVQVMTKKLWKVKFYEADPIYRKYRDENDAPPEIIEKCKTLFRKANGD